MKIYSAAATSDWGTIFTDERIKAVKWSTAFHRAGVMAQYRCRKRPKRISISLVYVGKEEKPTPQE